MSEQGVLYNMQRMSIHDGPGVRTTVFFKGCPLSCQWCGNPESQSHTPQLMVFENLCIGCGACEKVCPHDAVVTDGELYNRDMDRCAHCGVCVTVCPAKARVLSGSRYSVGRVMDNVRKDAGFYRNSDGGVTFGGGECSAQGAFLLLLLGSCRDEGFHTCVDTCGCCAPELFEQLIPLTDLFLYDVKHMDPFLHKNITGVDNKVILANLRTALKTVPQKVRIRMPLIPEINDDNKNIEAVSELLQEFGCHTLDVMPYHLLGRNKYLALHRPVPQFSGYTPAKLRNVLERFLQKGLVPTVV